MAASTAVLICRGIQTKQAYVRDVYVPDAAGGLCRFDDGAGAAGAATADDIQFNEEVLIEKLIQTGATTALRTAIDLNRQYTGNSFLDSFITPSATVIEMPYLGIRVPRGAKLSLRKVA